MNLRNWRIRLGLITWCSIASIAEIGLAAIPLQVGVYRVGSRYIQIAQRENRLCFHGFSIHGATTASLEPDRDRPDVYRVNGFDDTVLLQQDADTLLMGPIHYLNPYPADYEFPQTISDDLEVCLSSTKPFFKRISGGGRSRSQ